MRLLLVAPPNLRVDAGSADPTAASLGALADALVRAGHDVTLWAAPGSCTLAARRSVAVPSGATAAERDRYARLHVVAALGNARGYDAVHLYGVEAPEDMVAACPVPISRTLLSGLPRPGGRIITPSWAMRRALAETAGATFLGAVYPGIDVDACPYSDETDGYLVFTGPLTRERGLAAAVVAAYRSERPLYVIGPASADPAAFDEAVGTFAAAGVVRYLGDLPAAERRAVVSRAAALLLPMATPGIDYAGIEALACGTPVVTLDGGAARELIVHGESGVVARRLEELAAAVEHVDLIDRRGCRRRAEHCFSAAGTADGYAALLGGEPSGSGWAVHPELSAIDPIPAVAAG